MAGIERHHQMGPLHRPELHLRCLPQVGAVPGKDDVIFIPQHPRRQHIGGAAIKSCQNVGVIPMEPLGPHRQVRPLIAAHIPHPQASLHPQGGVVDQVHRPAHPLQDGLGLHQKGLARPGEGHRPGPPVKKSAAQRLLQQTDLLCDSSLGNVIALGCLGEALALRRGHEVFQLILVHIAPLFPLK